MMRMSEKFRSEVIFYISNILGDPDPEYIGDTETYDIAMAKSSLGVFIIGVFDTSPNRTVIIGQLPLTANVKKIKEEIEKITERYPCCYDEAMRELIELMNSNGIAFVSLECDDYCYPEE